MEFREQKRGGGCNEVKSQKLRSLANAGVQRAAGVNARKIVGSARLDMHFVFTSVKTLGYDLHLWENI